MKILNSVGVVATAATIAILLTATAWSAENSLMAQLKKRQQIWNGFVDNLYDLHKQRLQNFDYYTEEKIGGYGGVTDDLSFYHETRFFDSNNGKLLAVLQVERKNPKNIHMLDVYIYDKQGRIKREYSATYLPSRRTSPLETVITLHAYANNLHSFREFDASDVLFYEQCTDAVNEKNVLFALHYEDIPGSLSELEPNQQEYYRACFDHLDPSAGAYLDPLVELSGSK